MFLKSIQSNVGIHLIDNFRSFSLKKLLNNIKLQLNLNGSAKVDWFLYGGEQWSLMGQTAPNKEASTQNENMHLKEVLSFTSE